MYAVGTMDLKSILCGDIVYVNEWVVSNDHIDQKHMIARQAKLLYSTNVTHWFEADKIKWNTNKIPIK